MNKKILFVNVLVLGMAGVAVFFYFTEYEPVTALNSACLDLVNHAPLDEAFDKKFSELGCSEVMDIDEMKEKMKNRITVSSDQLEGLVLEKTP